VISGTLVDRNSSILLQGVPNCFGLTSTYTEPQTGNSPLAMALVSKWLDDCLSHHRRCIYECDSTLPARVLDLGVSSVEGIKLVESCGRTGRYLCLSYCWGKSVFIKTTRTNLDEHKKEIQLETLPPVFTDTIKIARTLGIRYVWIDALCILQDDKPDWEAESKLMAAVYRQSYLTLAAVSASSVEDKILSTPKHTERVGPVVTLVRKHFPRRADLSSEDFPMRTRAWTYQERLSAPRVLYISKQELLWECFENRLCECGGSTFYFINQVDKSDFYDVCLQPIHEDYVIQNMWRQLVIEYSVLNLTVAADKLPAISALANTIFDRRGSGYAAGLWKDSLIFDLCWEVGRGSLTKHDFSWRAPTWSWASIDGPITYDQVLCCQGEMRECRIQAEVREVYCPSEGSSPTGRVVRGCYVILNCELIPAQGTDFRVQAGNMNLYAEFDGRTERDAVEIMFFIPLYSNIFNGDRWELSGIFVTPSADFTGEFERVGFGHCYGDSERDSYSRQGAEKRLVKLI
jgi:hypothetical protein